MKSVYIIEDTQLTNDFLVQLVESYGSLTLAGRSFDGQEGMDECLRLRPDILIVDIFLPSINGVEIIQRIRKDNLDTAILGISASAKRHTAQLLMQAGIDAFVDKQSGLEELKKAIEFLISGQTYFSLNFMNLLRTAMMEGRRSESIDVLSSREKQILQLIAEGYSAKEIGEKLHISHKTVETHRSRITEKINTKTTAGLTRFAIAKGLVTGGTPPPFPIKNG